MKFKKAHKNSLKNSLLKLKIGKRLKDPKKAKKIKFKIY
jgi:hypothetical protein